MKNEIKNKVGKERYTLHFVKYSWNTSFRNASVKTQKWGILYILTAYYFYYTVKKKKYIGSDI